MSKNILPRICKECGNEFMGGPRAWYCPACRDERKRTQMLDFKRRKKAGEVVPIGSVIKCEICGKDIIKNSGLQRFCEECAKVHLKEVDNAQSLEWKRYNPEKIKESKRVLSKNRHREEGKRSGCVGVNWDKGKRVWIAKIGYAGKQYTIMRTKKIELAIKVRKEAEKALKNGDFEKWIEERKNWINN
ncbi:Uncharacterised protein [uncultured Clostridium sp.]|jgi:hypothetical protein|nr:MAG TPA: putative cytoplasmic protein [Herelleviridae sp.]